MDNVELGYSGFSDSDADKANVAAIKAAAKNAINTPFEITY